MLFCKFLIFCLVGVRHVSEHYNNVCIMFVEITNFDKMIEVENKNSIKTLDSLYRVFDRLCEKYDVQKIEVIMNENILH